MMNERMQKYTVRLSKVDSREVLRSYETIRKVSIEQGNKPPSLSQFMAGLILQSVTDQDETKEISYA